MTLRTLLGTALSRKGLAIWVSALLACTTVAASAEQIVVGVGIDPGYVAFFVAKHEKMFDKHGLDVKLINFASGPDALDSLIAGTASVAAAAEVTSIIRMGRGDVRSLGVVSQSGKYLKLAAKSTIADPAAIKTIGVVPGGAMEYLSGLTIRKYGLDPAKTKIVKAGPPEMAALLVRGDIDAFWLFEPFPSVAVTQGAHILANSGDMGYVYNFWVDARGSWLDTHKAEAQAMLGALSDACALSVADPQRAAEAVQAEAKIPVKETISFLQQIDCKMRDFTAHDMESYDAIADFLASAKLTAQRVDYRKHLELGFYQPGK